MLYEKINEVVDILPSTVTNELQKLINDFMGASGLFCRVFSRKKTGESVKKKFSIKKYGGEYKMQDLFGVRIALYFKDDISICKEMIMEKFEVLDVVEDIETTTNFEPIKLNIVCCLPDRVKELIDLNFWSSYPIDDTFEIQIRTVFSEGWQEIDHDLRYKCKKDWEEEVVMSRILNGIFATLETCDWSIISLFEQLAYEKYKSSSWESMLRNKLRIRMKEERLDEKIIEVFSGKKNVAKEFYKLEREKLIKEMNSNTLIRIPKSMNNIVYVANELYINDEDISKIAPAFISNMLRK